MAIEFMEVAMKRLLLSIIFLFAIQSSLVAEFTAYRLPNKSESWSALKFIVYRTEIRVQGLFYETSIIMRGKLGPDFIYWQGCVNPPTGNYEFVWKFSLPEDVVLSDCQLWSNAENRYVPASVIDLSTGEANYDPNSANTPQLLLREYRGANYNGKYYHFYQLRVAPVSQDEEKIIILRYIAPCRMFWDVRRIHSELRTFYYYESSCFINGPAEYYVVDYDNPNGGIQFVNYSYEWAKQGEFWHLMVDYAKYKNISSELIVRVPPENPSGSFFQIINDGENSFYELATLPHIRPDDVPPRHVILVYDLVDEHRGNWYEQRDYLIELTRWPIILGTTERDSLMFVTADFNTLWLDQEFKSRTTDLISNRLESLKGIIPKLNFLPFMLRQAVQFLNYRNLSGEIWYISNSDQFSKPPETAMDIVQQTYFSSKNLVKFRIVDLSMDYSNYGYVNNKYYRGNEYLYENLYRLSKGSYTALINYAYYDRQDAIIDCLTPTVSSVEIDPVPAGGLSFTRFPLNRGRQNFNITSRNYEIGMYEGDDPFELYYFGNLYGSRYEKNFTMKANTAPLLQTMRDMPRTYWYGQYVNELLKQPQSYSTIKYIEELSVKGHILTPYSGFVLPNPQGTAAFKRLALEDTSEAASEQIEQSCDCIPQAFQVAAFPNPFNALTAILISFPENTNPGNVELKIINTMGQIVRTFERKNENIGPMVKFEWDGCDSRANQVASGIYFAIVKTGSIVQNTKITLLR